MPQISFDSLDAIPEGLREGAKAENGKFSINVVSASKLDEFRTNNVALAQERDGLKVFRDSLVSVVGEDISAFAANYQELTSVAQQVKDGKLKGSEQITTEVNQRVAQMKTDYERQNSELAKKVNDAERKAGEYDQRFKRSIVDRRVTEAVISEASGANPSALSDILARAYGVFQVSEDGGLVARDGEAIIYGADGATPMSPIEWLGKLREQSPYFFKSSSGGGANGGDGKGGQFGGFSREDVAKMTPMQKLELAHKVKAGAR